MTRRSALAILAIATGLIFGGCAADDSPEPSPSPSATPKETEDAPDDTQDPLDAIENVGQWPSELPVVEDCIPVSGVEDESADTITGLCIYPGDTATAVTAVETAFDQADLTVAPPLDETTVNAADLQGVYVAVVTAAPDQLTGSLVTMTRSPLLG